jgi:hypothetical protein
LTTGQSLFGLRRKKIGHIVTNLLALISVQKKGTIMSRCVGITPRTAIVTLLAVALTSQGAFAFRHPSPFGATRKSMVAVTKDSLLNGNTLKFGALEHTSVTSLSMAGFGGGDGGKAKKGKSKKAATAGLKPKAQWDRYLDLKKETAVSVAIRILDSEAEEWLEVGNIKSIGGEYNELAVAKQRALIAEHAKRLYPLKVSYLEHR